MLVPYLNLSYEVREASGGAVVGVNIETFEHNSAGIHLLTHALPANLDPNLDYMLHVNASDSSGQFALPTLQIPIGGTGTVAPGTPPQLPPTGPVPVDPGTTPADLSTVHGVTAASGAAGLEISLDATLAGIDAADDIIYNVKFYALPGNTLVGKFTGTAGSGYAAGRSTITILRPDGSVVLPGDYRVVTVLYRNDWQDANKLLRRRLFCSRFRCPLTDRDT